MERGLRRNSRGNAGLAVVAVALLVLGGAAAVVLRQIDDGLSGGLQGPDYAGLVREAEGEGEALAALARGSVEITLAGGLDTAPGALGPLAQLFNASFAEALERQYPRLASSGRSIRATLEFARLEPEEGEASVASPFGGRFVQSVPLYLKAVGAVNVTVSKDDASASATVPFAARHPVPLLLPIVLAARVALESSPGGRVERLAGQAAQRSLEDVPGRALGNGDGAQLVRFALESELALTLGSSGNASLDAALKGLQAGQGLFRASSFFGGWAEGPEAFALDGLTDTFDLDGGAAHLTVVGLDTSNVSVKTDWTYFDGQELSNDPWGGLTLAVAGSFLVDLQVESPRGRAVVGPLEVPVRFTARAFTPSANGESLVGKAALDAALSDLSASGRASRFAPFLMLAGFQPNETGQFAVNASSRTVVLAVLVKETAVRLAPLENVTEFLKAWAPPVLRLNPATLIIDSPLDLNGSRAIVTVDGADAASGPVAGGRVELRAFPEGRHSVRVALEANGTEFVGQSEATLTGPSVEIHVAMAPTLSSAFLRDALARGEAVHERAGFAVLDEAGDIVGLERPTDIRTALGAAAFAEAVLLRLEALGWARAGTTLQQARVRDAALFLKVTALTLKAADASYKELHNESLPIGALASSAVELTFKPDVKSAVAVTVASLTLAKVAVEKGRLEVSFFAPGRTVGKLHFGFEHLLLVSTALGGALTLANDAVKVTKALNASSRSDGKTLGLLLASTATDFVGISVAIARGVYSLAGQEAFAAVKSTLGRLALAVGAAALIIDLATLYNKHGGDLGAVWEELTHPGSVGDLMHLPNLVGAAVAITVDIVQLAFGTAVAGGPIGIAASLFVLAALLVANKAQVASAIWGTIPYDALPAIRSTVAETLNASILAAASANTVDRARLEEAARASSAAGSTAWLRAVLGPGPEDRAAARLQSAAFRDRAAGALGLAHASAQMHFAAAALAEQLDDLASPAFLEDEGRFSEGYAFHFEPGKEVHYRGDTRVARVFEGGLSATLTRAEWRGLLEAVKPRDLGNYAFAYNLTETNGIPLGEYQRWADKVGAAGTLLEAAYGQVLAAENEIGSLSL